MATEFDITIQDGYEDLGIQYFQPGETIKGSVTVIPGKDMNCRHLYIRLLWHTEGRGTRYTDVVDEIDVFQGKLQNGMPRTFDYTFTLPRDPWSHEGHYVSVVWKIRAQIDLAWSSDPKGELAFVMAPRQRRGAGPAGRVELT